jgi:2'-5' RNA ligase
VSDQPDYSGSAMLALYPDSDTVAALALPDGLAPESLHVTVVYVGDAADVDPVALRTVAQQLSRRGAITAQVSGLARFVGGENDVLVALIDAPEVEDLRRDALDRCGAQGITVPREHGYCSHPTRSYVSPDAPGPGDRIEPRNATFTAISAVHGGNRTDYPLDDVPAVGAAAREAFARGWARTGGPMTERVKAGCTAAMRLAETHSDDPAILEVALNLGSLEGTWATVYQRRDELVAARAAKVNAEWKTVLTRDMLAAAVTDFRRRTGVTEATQDEQERNAKLAAAAVASAAAMMQLLPDRREWRALRRSLRDAIAAGRAEGAVGAVAVAAERVGQIGLNWDIAFTDAYRALENLDVLWAETDGWLARMLGNATADLGRALANAAQNGSTYAQMLHDAMAALDSQDVQAVSFTVDWAMTVALRQGALDLYTSENVTLIDWMDAGDGRVCPTCSKNADDGPYAPADYPAIPHPRCRCSPAASVSISNYAAWFAGP